jgi:WD40 repeat protein
LGISPNMINVLLHIHLKSHTDKFVMSVDNDSGRLCHDALMHLIIFKNIISLERTTNQRAIVVKQFSEISFFKRKAMALTCFPGALNPFCRQSICISSCSDQLALATSTSLVYIYSFSNQTLSFITKFSPHSKSLSCMIFHPTKSGLLVTGGAPNSRIILWSIEGKTIQKQAAFNLQRVSKILFLR